MKRMHPHLIGLYLGVLVASELPIWAAEPADTQLGQLGEDRPVLKLDGQDKTKGEGEEPGFPSSGKPELKMRYKGVAPGRAELPPHPPKLPLAKGPQRLTWPGFQIRDGKATVFLQLSGPVEFSVTDKPGQVQVTLHDTIANVRNNLRPLVVEEFRTPVKRISFESKKGQVLVTINVKGPIEHQERMETAENGYSMLVLQFPIPAGDLAAKPEKPEAKPETKPDKTTAKPTKPQADKSERPDDEGAGSAWTRPRSLGTPPPKEQAEPRSKGW